LIGSVIIEIRTQVLASYRLA